MFNYYTYLGLFGLSTVLYHGYFWLNSRLPVRKIEMASPKKIQDPVTFFFSTAKYFNFYVSKLVSLRLHQEVTLFFPINQQYLLQE